MRCRVGAFEEGVSLEVVFADAALGSWRRLNGRRRRRRRRRRKSRNGEGGRIT
jgi:hypothetical protein